MAPDGVNGTADDVQEYKTWRLGAQHMFSKQTKVYLGWANINPAHTTETDLITLGLRHNF